MSAAAPVAGGGRPPRGGREVIAHTTARQRRRSERPRIALNLTAMIDVTFLLLVYFMVATEFKLGEEVYRLDLPSRQPAQGQRDPFELDEQPLRIEIASTGPGAGYRLRVEGPYSDPPTSFEGLHLFLEQRRIKEGVGGLFAEDHPIIIEPTRTTRWQHALEGFNAAARAKYTNITFGKAE